METIKTNLINENKAFLVDFITNSISFEKFSVSKEVVENILEAKTEGIDAKIVKTVENYLDGIVYAEYLLSQGKDLDENDIKDIHEKVVDDFSVGGLYRNVDISIKGSGHTPPSHVKVYDRMKKYFDTINDSNNELYYNIAFSHLQLAKIHPFLDGNGRVARIVLNYQLKKNGLKPVIISVENKDEYFNLLEEFKVNKNIEPFIEYLKSMQ